MKGQGNKMLCFLSFFPKGFEINLFSDDSIIMKSVKWKQHSDGFSNTYVEMRKPTHCMTGWNGPSPKSEIENNTEAAHNDWDLD